MKAHAELGQMYIADEQFTAYYDEQAKMGVAKFLTDAIMVYTRIKKTRIRDFY